MYDGQEFALPPSEIAYLRGGDTGPPDDSKGYPSDGRERRFVNVYLVELIRGGPEEGGWYYQRGDPVESWEVTLLPRGSQEAEKTTWVAWCDEQNEGEPSLSSVLSRGLYEVQVEDSPAEPYPKERPFYE